MLLHNSRLLVVPDRFLYCYTSLPGLPLSVAVVPEAVSILPSPVSVVPSLVSMTPCSVSIVPLPVSMTPCRVSSLPEAVGVLPGLVSLVPWPVGILPLPVSIVPGDTGNNSCLVGLNSGCKHRYPLRRSKVAIGFSVLPTKDRGEHNAMHKLLFTVCKQ